MRIVEPRSHTVIVPAGKYILGDPCYSVPDDLWMPLLESCDFFEKPVGTVTREDGKTFSVLGFSTAYGDGTFRGSDGFKYAVDAGLIGLVPYELGAESFDESLATIIEFPRDATCTVDDEGYMNFGCRVMISTGVEDEEG